MEKFFSLLLLLFSSLYTYSQFSTQEGRKSGQYLLSCSVYGGSGVGGMLYKNSYGYYYIVIPSNNKFEDKLINIYLGSNKEESTTTLDDLYKCYSVWSKDNWYEIYGTKCRVFNSNHIFFYPEYSAGDYWLYKPFVKRCYNYLCDEEKNQDSEFYLQNENEENYH